MPVTITEIARLAGVSQSSVSRVLNGAPIRISDACRQRILGIARRLKYVPNRSAQALKTGRHGIIGVITYDITDAFAVACIAAMERYLTGVPLRAMWVSCTHADQGQVKPLHLLQEVAQSADGIIVISAERFLKDADIVKFWAEKNIPMVSVIRRIAGGIISSVTIDEHLASSLLVNHLLQLGHKHIAFCYRIIEHLSVVERHQAYRELLLRHNMVVDANLQLGVEGSVQSGYQAGLRLLKRRRRPTAIIGFNDLTGIGLIKACYDLGVRVPEEVSIGSFDNIPMAEAVSPSLTTVGVDFARMAEVTIDELVHRINVRDTSKLVAQHNVLQPRLFVRQSTAVCLDKCSEKND